MWAWSEFGRQVVWMQTDRSPIGPVYRAFQRGFLRYAPRGSLISQRVGFVILGVAAIVLGALLGANPADFARAPHTPTQIFQGIAYGRELLVSTDEGGGLLHWVRVDLSVPGVNLYVTPLDPTAAAHGWQYRLRGIGEVADREQLAVVINGTLFTSKPSWRPRLAGDLARSVETVVADHVVSHVWEHTYLLWFDEQLKPSLEMSKPPPTAALAMAKWGIGGQGIGLRDGKVWPSLGRAPDSRTAVAIDRARQLLFLAVGGNISPRRILQELADRGATDGMLLDGGNSSSMAIGKNAQGISAGIVYGGWRPVATHFGVKARPLQAGR
jgi:hypothetical protein